MKMNKKKKSDDLEGCINQLKAEQELISGTFTIEGFIDRIVCRFMPILRNHSSTKRRIEAWEKYHLDDTLKIKAYQELEDGYQAITKAALSRGDNSLIETLDNIMREVRAASNLHNLPKPPYQRAFPHFRAFYMHNVSYEQEFAPSVTLLKEKDSYMYQLAESDKDPKYIWGWFLFLERLWKLKNQCLSISWPSSKKNGIELWLELDHAWREAKDNYLASILKSTDVPRNRDENFDRSFFERMISRIIKELPLRKERNDPRTRDRIKAEDFIDAYWQRKPDAKHEKILKALKGEIDDRPQWLELKQQDSTLLTWIRGRDKRKEKPRGPGKKM
jgi:hypothetical protein